MSLPVATERGAREAGDACLLEEQVGQLVAEWPVSVMRGKA